jgi:hypothetical protein
MKRKNELQIVTDQVQKLSIALGQCFQDAFPSNQVYLIQDIPGEDHIYAQDENGKPVLDMLITARRKFAFLWYYLQPEQGLELVSAMKKISLSSEMDFVVKFPNFPVPKDKMGWPTIIRYGKHPAGQLLERFITKRGNPSLEQKKYTAEDLKTYRNYEWFQVPGALDRIQKVAEQMVAKRLGRNVDKMANIRAYLLYAGCAYSYAYPGLGFGMRDIDVEILFSPEWYTNTRAAYTWECGIKEFGTPNYFGGKTRWLDLMYNTLHTETGDIRKDLETYIAEMRGNSDRWATMSQRPFVNLIDGEILYRPSWMVQLHSILGAAK